jgi:hypothetical protein
MSEITIFSRSAPCSTKAALKEREMKYQDLTSRIRLGELLPAIKGYIQRAQWVSKAEIARGRFQGVFRSLTETSKAASERLLNQDFERRFNEECHKLRALASALASSRDHDKMNGEAAVHCRHQESTARFLRRRGPILYKVMHSRSLKSEVELCSCSNSLKQFSQFRRN